MAEGSEGSNAGTTKRKGQPNTNETTEVIKKAQFSGTNVTPL